MNRLLLDCCSRNDRNVKAIFSKLVLLCLLHPLAEACNQYKQGVRIEGFLVKVPSLPPLTGEQEVRLRLRLEYLANTLRPRLIQISYQDILQIELEVTRVLRAVSSPLLTNQWFDTTKYTWEKDKNIMETYYCMKPLEKFSSTLKTRNYEKHWYQCPNKHLYVRENEGSCVTCIWEEGKNKIRSQADQSGQNDRNHLSLVGNEKNNYMSVPVTDYRKRGRGGRRGRGERGRYRGRW